MPESLESFLKKADAVQSGFLEIDESRSIWFRFNAFSSSFEITTLSSLLREDRGSMDIGIGRPYSPAKDV